MTKGQFEFWMRKLGAKALCEQSLELRMTVLSQLMPRPEATVIDEWKRADNILDVVGFDGEIIGCSFDHKTS